MRLATLTGALARGYGCAFSPDGNTLAATDVESNLKLWEALPLEEIDRDPQTMSFLDEH